jgi:hypothetical protein
MNLISFKIDTSSILALDADQFHALSQLRQRPAFRPIDLPPGLCDPSDMPHVQPLRNPLTRNCCFAAQPPRQGQFDVRSLGQTPQIRFSQFQRHLRGT